MEFKEIPVGNNFTLGEVAAPLTTVTTPQRLILEVSVNNRKMTGTSGYTQQSDKPFPMKIKSV